MLELYEGVFRLHLYNLINGLMLGHRLRGVFMELSKECFL